MILFPAPINYLIKYLLVGWRGWEQLVWNSQILASIRRIRLVFHCSVPPLQWSFNEATSSKWTAHSLERGLGREALPRPSDCWIHSMNKYRRKYATKVDIIHQLVRLSLFASHSLANLFWLFWMGLSRLVHGVSEQLELIKPAGLVS